MLGFNIGSFLFIEIKDNIQDYIKYLGNVAEEAQVEVDRKIPRIASATTKAVKKELDENTTHYPSGRVKSGKGGYSQGIYKKSIRSYNFAESKWHVGFQVYAKKPHYRLSHLLENGHVNKQFRWGKGSPTRFGNKGMIIMPFKTIQVPHIEPGQEFANEKVIEMYHKALNESLSKGMKKL